MSGCWVRQPAHQVELGADRPRAARRSRLERVDDELGGAHQVGRLDHLVLALGVHQHLHVRALRPCVDHVLQREPAVHAAVPAPQDHPGVPQLLRGEPAGRLVRVVQHAVVEREAHLADGGVASQVLVGQEEHLAPLGGTLRERPGQSGSRVGRRAHRAAVTSGEPLDRGRRVHVGDGHDVVGDARLHQHVPRVLDLADRGHVGHRAAGGEVGQHDLLGVGREDVGALGHEVHAAEDDVLGLRPGRRLPRELERVAGDVGELDDLVALVVVAEDEHLVAQGRAGGAGALDQVGVGRRGQVAGALHAALAGQVRAAAAEQQQGRRGRRGFREGTHG